MKSFLLGLIVILCGGAVMYFNRWFEENFGRNAWAETNIGGTHMMYVLFGFGMVIVGILMMFGFGSGQGGDPGFGI